MRWVTRQEIADARFRTDDSGNPNKDPNYLIDGHVFDCYSPTLGKPVRGVWSEVRAKVDKEQTQRVVAQGIEHRFPKQRLIA
ncbi:hypothetical protein ACQP08_09450 [Micromonospora zamorensis]|uniref:CdiA C-terminal domain-containing protein n=1 Tax=Micromonospora zamorensis TaxID=709883 RepID=UPI003D90BEEC